MELSPAKKAWITRRENAERLKAEQERAKNSARAKKAWETIRSKQALPFKNEDGENKKLCRTKKAELYKNSGLTSGRVLILPSQTCADIYEIDAKIPKNNFKFIGCEIDNKAFKVIQKKIKNEKLDDRLFMFNTDITRVLKSAIEGGYSHIDLDLCQSFRTFKHTVEIAVNEKLVKKNGIISFTFSTRDVKGRSIAKEILGDDVQNGYTITMVNKWLKELCGKNFKIAIAPYTYSDSKNGVGGRMVFGSIQRVK